MEEKTNDRFIGLLDKQRKEKALLIGDRKTSVSELTNAELSAFYKVLLKEKKEKSFTGLILQYEINLRNLKLRLG